MAGGSEKGGIEQLKQLIPLNNLPEKELNQLLESSGIQTLDQGGVLFKQGDTEPYNVYLLDGKVDLLAKDRVMDSVEAGTSAANYALAHRFPRELTARAKTKIRFLAIDSRMLGEVVERCRQDSFRVDDINSEGADDWMSQLLRSQVFQYIPPANLQSVMIRMEQVEVEAGQVVVKEGDVGDYFYLINRGECSVSRKQPHSDEGVEVARLGPGASFGEESLLADSPRGGSVTMLSDGILQRLGKDDFVELVKTPLAHYVSYKDALTLVEGGGEWLDIRTQEEYEAGHMPGAVNAPLGSLRYLAESLSSDKRQVIYCKDGSQSPAAAFLLTEREFEVYALEGGLARVPVDTLVKPAEVGEQVDETETEQEEQGQADPALKEKYDEAVEKWKQAEAKVKVLEIRLTEMEKAVERHDADAEQALQLWMDQQQELEDERDRQEERIKKLETLCQVQAKRLKKYQNDA